MTAREDVIAAIGRGRLVPVLRADSADAARSTVERLLDGGITVVELTATTPDWPDVLAWTRERWPEATIGAGTVVTAQDATAALERGADFLVSPYPAPAVRPVADAAGALFVEGGLTPGELAAAAAHGPAKVFPAHVGGPAYLRSVLQILPGARLVPTGGIALGQVADYLAAGAFAVGVGRDLAAAPDVAAAVRTAVGGPG